MKIDSNNLAINHYITQNNKKVKNDIEKLADPSKTNDIVNQFVQDVLNSQMSESMQEINNFNEAVGFMQIADGALNSISDDLGNIKTLQVAANNATLNSDNLAAINAQIDKYAQNINQTLNTTTYNDKSVFGEFNFNGVDVNTQMPSFSLDKMDEFEDSLNQARSSVGAFMNEANSKIDNLGVYVATTANAKSQNEVDVAQTVTDLQNNKVKLNAAMLAQAHNISLSQQNLMNLLS
jgi:flagellin